DPAATSRTGGSAPATDAVSLTPQSRQLREVESKLSETPAFDSARVAELRKAIERGEYRVDSRRVAGKLLEFERDLSAPGAGD
ncbi:MAG TPA: flagellar biosynthesis anti-sigma factor FlgM, partial [Plasticicumulans sp.]